MLKVTKQALEELAPGTEVEYVTDVQKMVEMGIMQTPALVIDGTVVLSGFVPDLKTVRNKIKGNG